MSEEFPELPKVTPDPEMIGIDDNERREVVAMPVGELTVADVLGENSFSVDIKTDNVVDGNGIFEVESDGAFISPDGSKEYNPHTKQWDER